MKLVESIAPIKRLLTEDNINSFRRFQYPELSIFDMLSILEYSSDWDSGAAKGLLKFTPTSDLYANIDKLIAECAKNNFANPSKAASMLKMDVTAKFPLELPDSIVTLQDGSASDVKKTLIAAIKRQKYQQFKIVENCIDFDGSFALAYEFFHKVYKPAFFEYASKVTNLKLLNDESIFIHYKPETEIQIFADFYEIDDILFSKMNLSENIIQSLMNEHFEFARPLTPKMKWLLNVSYNTLTGKNKEEKQVQVSPDYMLEHLPNPESPDTMKSKSGKPLKHGDIIQVDSSKYRYDADQYFFVSINQAGNKQGAVALQPKGSKLFGFNMQTKDFTDEIPGKTTDVPEDCIMKNPPAKGNPVDPTTKKKNQKLTVLFKKNGTPFQPGDIYKIKGKNTFVELAGPDPSFDTTKDLLKYLKTSDAMYRIHLFEDARRKELQQLANAKQAKIDQAAEEEWDKKKLKEELEQLESSIKDNWQIGFDIDKLKTFNDTKQYVTTIDDYKKQLDTDDEDDVYSKFEEKEPTIKQGSCSERRLKLFTAAQKRGAKVTKTEHWIIAACYNSKQVAVFGRMKPRVKPGTNIIDPACNLEDWEGITPENKKKRDSTEMQNGKLVYPVVMDNIDDGYGNSFNRLFGNSFCKSYPHTQWAETQWCVCGVENGNTHWGFDGAHVVFFNNYTNNGKHPIIAMMDVKRGALYLYARYTTNYSKNIIVNFLNENERIDDKPDMVPSDNNVQMNAFNARCQHDVSLYDITQRINRIYFPDYEPVHSKSLEKTLQKMHVADSDDSSIPVVKRRFMLFKAAKHFGAEVHQTSDWIYAVCRTPAQVHPFGRNKPVAKDAERKIIDEACNIEDWDTEKKITPENRAKRDDKTLKYPRIKDGIVTEGGKPLDEHGSYTQQGPGVKYAESNWCICGTLHGYENFEWESKSTYGYNSYYSQTNPAIVFMDLHKGLMFLYCNGSSGEEFKNELDLIDVSGFNSKQWLYGSFYKDHPSFAVLHEALVKKYYPNAAGAQQQTTQVAAVKTPEELKKEAKDSGKIDKNGFLIISSREEAKKYEPIFDAFSGIKVDNDDADKMFEGLDFKTIEKFDLKKVQSAECMFSKAKLGCISILNSENVYNMQGMFQDATLAEISQIDTSNAHSLQCFLYHAKTEKNAPLIIPTLDISMCEDISMAFSGTTIRKINLKNVGSVRRAVNVYWNCPFLAVYPETKFPNMKDITDLIASGMPEDIFSGCFTLTNISRRKKISGYTVEKEQKFQAALAEIKNLPKDEYEKKRKELSLKIFGEAMFDFDEMLAETARYYKDNEGKKDDIEIDEDDMVVVRSRADVLNAVNIFNRHAGVRVDVSYAKELFAKLVLDIKVLDLTAVRNAFQMFQSATVRRLDAIIGSENIKQAGLMFSACRIGFMPEIDLSNACSIDRIFVNTRLVELPKGVKFNMSNITDQYYSADKADIYIFGPGYEVDAVANRLGKDRMQAFAMRYAKQAVFNKYCSDDNDYMHVYEDGFISVKGDNNYVELLQNFKDINKERKNKNLKEIIGLRLKDHAHPDKLFQSNTPLDMPELEMPPIDLTDINDNKNASLLFCGIEVKSIKTIIGLDQIKYANEMFAAAKIGELPDILDLTSLISAPEMFSKTNLGKKISLSNIKFSNALKDMTSMFAYSEMFDSIVLNKNTIDMSGVENAPNAFSGIASDITIEDYEFKSLVDCSGLFFNSALTKIGSLSLPAATGVSFMFEGSSVKTIGKITANSATYANGMFNECLNLETICRLDMTHIKSIQGIFQSCEKLTSIPVLNINPDFTESSSAMQGCQLAPVYGEDMQIYRIVMKNSGNIAQAIANLDKEQAQLNTDDELDI